MRGSDKVRDGGQSLFGGEPWPRPRPSVVVVVLRREHGVTTGHALPDGDDLAVLMQQCGDGIELRVMSVRPAENAQGPYCLPRQRTVFKRR